MIELNNKDCDRCYLSKYRRNVVNGRGNLKAKLVFVGEAPGAEEDKQGVPFVGKSGQLNDLMIAAAGIPDDYYFITNACRCRPKNNRTPKDDEIDACNDYLFEEIDYIKPRAIVCLGSTAIKAVLGIDILVGKNFGDRYDFKEEGISVFVAFHPNYIRLNPDRREQQEYIYYRAYQLCETGLDPKDEVGSGLEVLVKKPEVDYDLKDIKLFDASKTKENVMSIWSKGHTLYLLKKKNGKQVLETRKFTHYVLIRKRDWDSMLKNNPKLIDSYKKKGLLNYAKPDPHSPKWIRLYVNLSGYLSRLASLGVEYKDLLPSPGLVLSREIYSDYGILTYEGDIDPPFRYMIDNNIGYHPFDDYKILFFDMETDDSHGFDMSNMRILSIAYGSPSTGKVEFDWADSNSDKDERELLKRFKKVTEDYDILIAWNGEQFDFILLVRRSELYGIYYDIKKLMFIDHMVVFDTFYQKSEGKITSKALDAVSRVVLGEDRGKINIGYICTECGKESKEFGLCECGAVKRKKKMIELYHEWITEKNDILEDYNKEDVQLMMDIEEKTGLIRTMITMNHFSGVMVNIVRPSPKIDSLMLRTGYLNKVHFRTRLNKGERDATFIGAYVLPTVAGFYDSLAVLDFASMYISIYRTFNICPTTLIRDWELDRYDKDNIIETPDCLCLTKGCSYVDDSWEKGKICPRCKKEFMFHGVYFVKDREGFVPAISTWTTEMRNKWRKIQSEYEVGSDKYMDCERNAYAYKQLGLCFYGDLGNIYSRYYHPELAATITKIARYIIFRTLHWLDEQAYLVILCDTDSAYVVPKTKLSDFDDLDSFIEVVVKEVKELLPKYQKYIEDVLKQFNIRKSYIELEFETVYSPVVITEAKKRYAGKVVWRKGKRSDHLEIKGLEAIRTDVLPIAKIMQRKIIDMILSGESFKKVLDYILEKREQIIYGRLPFEHVVMTKGLSKDTEEYYGIVKDKQGKPKLSKTGKVRKKTVPVHVRVAEWIKDNNREYYIGMKVPYVVIGSQPKLIAIHAEDYYEAEFESFEDILNYECEAADENSKYGFNLDEYLGSYDPIYYWDRATFPCLERILELVYPTYDWKSLYLKTEKKMLDIYYRYVSKIKIAKTDKKVKTILKKALVDERLSTKYKDMIRDLDRVKNLED